MYSSGNADLSALEMENSRSPLYKHVAKTYAWMFLGLVLTFVTGFTLYATRLVFFLYVTWWLPFALLIAKLGLVIYLTANLHKFKVATTRIIFLAYSVLTGVVFSSILLVYQMPSVILIFGMCSLFFGIMAAAGLLTKRDVSKFGPIITIGLITLLVMQLVNMFLGLDSFDAMLCFIGIAMFLGITTYDSKKTKDLYFAFENDSVMLDKISIYSALNLYLDFINLFLYLIRLLGKRK